ncbi:MAG: PD-(D/E)XK nuclease family protein [Clostridiales bacterium]|nr:PD-(D/E)XK nuclease family protein [Candidatus Equinaster intestinalis]
MLKLIIGRAGTGKTYTVFERIKKDVISGKKVVLLVPEQFTFECERTLLHTLGDKASTNAQVLSFTRLYDEVARKVGGRVADMITESDRAILMGQALKASAPNLQLWGKYAASSRFSKTLLSAVNELKAAAVSSKQLLDAAKDKQGYFAAKLNDLATVYGAYNAMLGERFIDPHDNMDRLADHLLEYKFFEGKTVYVDSFKNFSGQQYKIVERLINQADSVTFCFTTPDVDIKPKNEEKIDIFKCVRETVKRIYDIAQNNGKHFETPECLTEFHFKNESLKDIESIFSDFHKMPNETLENVNICCCDTVYDEAEFAARTIRRLVRTEGYRYRDFVIIARDAEKYRTAVQTACRKNGVFCFFDKRQSIEKMPFTVLISGYLKLLNGYKTEVIFETLRTNLGVLSEQEIYELENYTYVWSIEGSAWQNEWNMGPDGFGIQDDTDKKEASAEKLSKINESRRKIIDSVGKFRRAFAGTPADMAVAIVKLAEDLCVTDKLKALYGNDNSADASEIKLGYDAIMDALNGIVKCLPEKEITQKEFISNWQTATESITIGNIPQMLDEVTFGSADRIRPSRPQIAFILGAYQDEFPKALNGNCIFAESEKAQLKNAGINIYSDVVDAAIDEDYLVYTSLCCAAEKLYITYPQFVGLGNAVQPSSIVTTITDNFKDSVKIQYEPSPMLSCGNIPETADTAVALMCGMYNTNRSASKTVQSVLEKKNGISVEDFLRSSDKQAVSISAQNAEKLYGKKLSVSATKFETFHRCKFGFFCKYGLNAAKLQPADLNVLQRGTMVHYVMEHLIKDYKKEIGTFTREQTDALTEKYVNDYLAQIEGIENFLTERMKYLIGKITALIKDVAFHIAREFAQTEFSPDYCELSIGKDGTVKPKAFVADNGMELNVQGSIDRVDIWNGYVRVVDYKTGTKNFKLSDTLVGLNMQMLIYLYSLVRCSDDKFNALKSAGVLYVPAKREKDEKSLVMNGIILDEEQVYTAMEKENAGEFIPKYELYKNCSLKSTGYVASSVFDTVFDYTEKLLNDMAADILDGKIEAIPTDSEKDACKYCDYYSVCCIENGKRNKAQSVKNSDVISIMKGEKTDAAI